MIDEAEEVLYALILERDSPKPVHEIGRIVARQLDMPSPDAVAQVRYGGGLLAEALSEAQAHALVEALGGIDVRTRPVPAEEWLTVPRGYKISSLRFGEDDVEACLATGRKLVVPKRDIFGLHLYGLCPDDVEARQAGGRAEAPTSIERSGLSTLSNLTARGRRLLGNLEENGLTAMELHLTLYAPPSVGPLRIRRLDFSFSGLGEAKLDHSLDNFILLLEKLVATLPNAWNAGRVRRFLDDMDPMGILYFKAEEAQNFDRWMLQWVAIEARERESASRMTNDANEA